MCVKPPKVDKVQVAAPDNAEASFAAMREAQLRRRRAGSAADILTSPTGVPATTQLGRTR